MSEDFSFEHSQLCGPKRGSLVLFHNITFENARHLIAVFERVDPVYVQSFRATRAGLLVCQCVRRHLQDLLHVVGHTYCT